MIARITVGRGSKARSFDVPSSRDRKQHVADRLAMGNILKSKFLFTNNRAFRAAKARGEKFAAIHAAGLEAGKQVAAAMQGAN